jgi:hypothetical protein
MKKSSLVASVADAGSRGQAGQGSRLPADAHRPGEGRHRVALLRAAFQASCADMAGQTSAIADLQAAWPQMSAQGVKVEVQWSSNDGVIVPATNSRNPAPAPAPALAVNVDVASTLGHNAIPTDPGLAETVTFFTR